MSTRIRPAIEKLAEMEEQDANRKFPLFHSMHEGYAVLLEEAEEARVELSRTKVNMSANPSGTRFGYRGYCGGAL